MRWLAWGRPRHRWLLAGLTGFVILEPSAFRILVVLLVFLVLNLLWHMRHGPRVSPF
jgi:hypothetical protein